MKKVLSFIANFLREHTNESMMRLCTLIIVLTVCGIWISQNRHDKAVEWISGGTVLAAVLGLKWGQKTTEMKASEEEKAE